jgi:hypothetical protein
MALLALVARAGRSGVLAALAACVLTLVGQRVLVDRGDTSAWFGALHAQRDGHRPADHSRLYATKCGERPRSLAVC